MATLQKQLLKLALLVGDARTKDDEVFNDLDAGVSITNAVNNGAGLIRLTASNHGLSTGDKAIVGQVTGTVEANSTVSNPFWTITKIDANTLDLQGSAFVNAYVSGGKLAKYPVIGSAAGGTFLTQRLLDIYNEARVLLFNSLLKKFDKQTLSQIVKGLVVRKTNLSFDTNAEATMPTDYFTYISLYDNAKKELTFRPANFVDIVRSGEHPDYIESADKRFVFEIGEKIIHFGGFVPQASTYVLSYFGLTEYVLNQLWDGTKETFDLRWQPAVVKLAGAIAIEMTEAEILQYVEILIAETVGAKAA